MGNWFLPENYEIPTSESRYTKFEKDKTTKIRVLKSWMDQDCIVFWEYFQIQADWKTKPIRSKTKFNETPWIENWKIQKEIWGIKVFNYETQSIQICNIGQKWIKETIMNFINDEDYGSPLLYDLKISRQWDWLDTKYGIVPWKTIEFDEKLIEWKDIKIDWVGFLNSEKDIFSENK